jgi:hypothetical protein
MRFQSFHYQAIVLYIPLGPEEQAGLEGIKQMSVTGTVYLGFRKETDHCGNSNQLNIVEKADLILSASASFNSSNCLVVLSVLFGSIAWVCTVT